MLQKKMAAPCNSKFVVVNEMKPVHNMAEYESYLSETTSKEAV